MTGDMRGELMLRGEMIGHYRKTGEKEKAFRSIEEALRLLKELDEIRRAPDGMLPVPKFTPEVTFPRRRAASTAETPRVQLESVPNDQIRKVMAEVENDLGACEPDTLYRETARRFGYKTLSPKARQRLEGVRRF